MTIVRSTDRNPVDRAAHPTDASPSGREGPLSRFTRTMIRHRRIVVGAWVFAVAAVSWLGVVAGGDHKTDYSTPGSDSAKAQSFLAGRIPELSGDTVTLVFRAPSGVAAPTTSASIDSIVRRARRVAHVAGTTPAGVSDDGTVLIVSVQMDTTAEKVPVASGKALIDLASQATTDRLRVEVGGATIQFAESREAGPEQIGLIAALLILLVVFGSVLAAGLPLVVALVGVGTSLAAVPLLTHVLLVPDWAPQLVTMVGIGVGIDYALFIVTRHRAAMREGRSPEDAIVMAMTTAGRAVLFAGGTVVISLLGLCTMGLNYLYGTAASVVLGVALVLLATMTLLPAMLGFAGRSIDRFRLPFVRGGDEEHGLWARWSRVVQRRPGVTGLLSLLVLLVVAAPVPTLRFGYPDAGSGKEHLTSKRAYDTVSSSFGPGSNSPLVVAVDPAGDPASVSRIARALATTPGVAAVMPPTVSRRGDAAVIFTVPRTGPQDKATSSLIHRLRDNVIPAAVSGTRATVWVGGATAAYLDESEYMAPRLPVFIGAVILLSFVLLLTVFRSVLVALKAAIMNVLAIGAAYGVMAFALQGGWLGHLVGITQPTPIPVWAPMMMFAILFGLSMDYEVFLLSRIREEYVRTHNNAEAVAHGMARTGRVISAAAAIMVTVFGAFVLSDQVLVKVIGIGLATAVLLDATVVRMVLVPSAMELLGDRNWWMPAWLDRVLPHVDIEGDGSRDDVADPPSTAPLRAA